MKFILTICIFIVFSSSAYSSEKNFFNEAKMLYEEEFTRAMQDNREKVDLKIVPDLGYSI